MGGTYHDFTNPVNRSVPMPTLPMQPNDGRLEVNITEMYVQEIMLEQIMLKYWTSNNRFYYTNN
jgi:hypothetical protein